MEEIRDLEKKYMEEIWEIISGNEFSSDLKKIESYIKSHYKELNENYQIKNKLQLGAERLMYFYMFRHLKINDIYCSPISSDLAFYTDDALVNIDAKTIDLSGNAGDDNWVQFGPHQISFTNKNFYNRKIGNINFKGVSLKPGLPEIDPVSNLPCLTFFVGITYKDDGNGFDIHHIKVTCVPNGKVVREDYNNDLIQNFKTYRYLNEQAASKLGNQYMPKKQNFSIPNTWIPMALKGGSGAIDSWLDTILIEPFDSSRNVVWRILDKKYCVCLGGSTARINPDKIKNRKDSLGNNWLGIRKKILS